MPVLQKETKGICLYRGVTGDKKCKEKTMILPFETASRRSAAAMRITAVFLAVFCLFQMTAFAQETADASVSVTVTDGDESVTVDTATGDVGKIVAQAGFKVGPNDRITSDSFVPGEGGTINVDRAKVVKVENSDITAYYVGYGTLGEIFDAEGISIQEDDEIFPLLDQPVYDGMKVTLRSIYNVIVNADNRFRTVLTSGGTVAGALDKLGIVLGDGDFVSADLDKVINCDTVINVIRGSDSQQPENTDAKAEDAEGDEEETTAEVTTKEETTTRPETTVLTTILTTVATTAKPTTTAAPTTTEAPATTAPATTKPEVTKVSVTKGSGDRLAAINFKPGLKPVSDLTPPSTLKLDENGLPVEYKKVVEGKATAYTGGTKTASGRPTKQGHIAVDPKLYPYGTEMYIVSCDGNYIYGYCIAADTGGFVNHDIADFDLYFNTYDQCCQWGNRMVRVYVL